MTQSPPGWPSGSASAVGNSSAYGGNPVIRLDAELTTAAEAAERAISAPACRCFAATPRWCARCILEARGADDRPVQTVGLAPVSVIQMRSYMEQAARFEKLRRRQKAWVSCQAAKRRGRAHPRPCRPLAVPGCARRAGSALAAARRLDPQQAWLRCRHRHVPDQRAGAAGDARSVQPGPTPKPHWRYSRSFWPSFPWSDDDAKAVAFSALISPVVRAALPTVPLHAISAPEKGSGKSYLCDLAAAIATGFCCPAAATGRDEEELEKRLVAAVLDAQPILSLDNVSRPLGGDFLCQLLDRPLLKVRVLGQSAGPRIEPRLIVLATGNNLTPDRRHRAAAP